MRHPRFALPILSTLLVAAVPATASARGLTISVPKSVQQYRSFAVTYEGDTGPGDQAGGGFIVQNRIKKGKGACPANAAFKIGDGATGAGNQNVFHAGAFRGADQLYLSNSGTHRVCGYVTTNASSQTYELLYDKLIKVKALPRRAKYKLNPVKLGDGTYTAGPADIVGGTPASSLSFVIAGGKMTSVNASGIPQTACSPDFRVQTPIVDTIATTTPEVTSNQVIGQAVSARFVVAPPSGSAIIDSAAKSGKEIWGALSEDSSDGSCRGGFGFRAKR